MLLIDTPAPVKLARRATELTVRGAVTHPPGAATRPAPASAPTRSLAEAVAIEPAGVRDWLPICDMVARNFPLETEENLGHWLCHQLPYFRVARIEGQVVGFLHAQPRRDTGTLWINMLAVDHRYRSRGIAHRLVEHFESVARDWGCQAIGLQCLVSNTAAVNLYERHGYARLNESIADWGLRVVAYRKALRIPAAPPSAPRPPVALHGKAQRMLYRLWYLGWFRQQSPLVNGPAPVA
jgi:GNAT superfamily N-acetyltransferase